MKSLLFIILSIIFFIVGLNQNYPGWMFLPSMFGSLVLLALGIVHFKDSKVRKRGNNNSQFIATLILVTLLGIGVIYLVASSQ